MLRLGLGLALCGVFLLAAGCGSKPEPKPTAAAAPKKNPTKPAAPARPAATPARPTAPSGTAPKPGDPFGDLRDKFNMPPDGTFDPNATPPPSGIITAPASDPPQPPDSPPEAPPSAKPAQPGDAEIAKRLRTKPDNVKLAPLEFKVAGVEMIMDVPEGTTAEQGGISGAILSKGEEFSLLVTVDDSDASPARTRLVVGRLDGRILVDEPDFVAYAGEFIDKPTVDFATAKTFGFKRYYVGPAFGVQGQFDKLTEAHARLVYHCSTTLRRKSPQPTDAKALLSELGGQLAFAEPPYERVLLAHCTSEGVAAGLAHAPKVKFLHLVGGIMDDKAMPAVAKCADLELIQLEHTSITDEGLKLLAPLRKLKKLHMESSITHFPNQIHGSGFIAFKDCPMEEFTLFAGPIEQAGWNAIGVHKGLKGLRAPRNEPEEGNITDDALRAVAGCVLLEELDARNGELTDAGLEIIGKFTKLRSLQLGDTKITDAGFAKLKDLTELTYLDLADTAITDASLPVIQGFKDSRSSKRCSIAARSSRPTASQSSRPRCRS